ncbi:MAG: glycosyltransferase [Fibrobacter sp.]|nr:glycosyltransferase [Fibrobacter sp.]
MQIIIFGLSVSSSWGNGHATIWRGLISELTKGGHGVTFFERDVSYYAYYRDFTGISGMELVLYKEWDEVKEIAVERIGSADVSIVTSYCPDALKAAELLKGTDCLKVFYDLDSPVTLKAVERGVSPEYIGDRGLSGYDLVLSYTGGIALEKLVMVLGARHALPLYGSFDPGSHHPAGLVEDFRSDLSYLGTFASDRQSKLDQLFIQPARMLPSSRFVLAGAQYPKDFPWTENIFFVNHLSPPDHPGFYCSSRFTLNITREAMAEMGFCPSGRLFEAAGCKVPVISDWWPGLERFFEPGKEIIVVKTAGDVLDAMKMSDNQRVEIAEAAFKRATARHTASTRAQELIDILESF